MLILCFLLNFVACNKEDSSQNTGTYTASQIMTFASNDEPSDTNSNVTSVSVTEPATPVPNVTPTPSPQKTTYSINWSEGFYEDRDWVGLDDPSGKNTIALIDTDGQIILKTDSDSMKERFQHSGAFDQLYHTKMDHGYAAFYFTGGGYSDHNLEGLLIIDKNGNETFSSIDGDDSTHYTFVTQFGDKFLIRKIVSSFSEASCSFQIIDAYGNVIVDNVQFDLDPSECYVKTDNNNKNYYFNYLGDSQYVMNDILLDGSHRSQWVFNSNTNAFINLRGFTRNKVCEDGTIIMENGDKYIELTTDDLFDQSRFDNAIGDDGKYITYYDCWLYARDTYNNGIWFDAGFPGTPIDKLADADKVYKDKNKNTVLTIVDMPDAVNCYYGTAFENGYSFITMIGADGKKYYAHINESGKFQYDPIQINDDYSTLVFSKGYVFLVNYSMLIKVLTPDGRFLTANIDDLSELGDMTVRTSDGTIVSDGFYGLTRLDGRKIEYAYEYDSSAYEQEDSSTDSTHIPEIEIIPGQTQSSIEWNDEPLDGVGTTAEIITFGSYGGEPIQWVVLDKNNSGELLLLSLNALDAKPYNTDASNVSWETCSLREWLNTEFYETAFSPEEQEMIISTNVNNQDGVKHESDIVSGNNTIDKVFLLSLDEAYYYYQNCNMGLGFCKATDYAINNSSIHYDPNNNECLFWWLRDIRYEDDGVFPLHAMGGYQLEEYNSFVALSWGSFGTLTSSDGTITRSDMEEMVGVRPVIWIKS